MEKFTFQIGNAIKAVGKVRNYQIVESIIPIMVIPIAYYLFELGFGPTWIFIIGLFAGLLVAVVRLYFGKVVVGINAVDYFKLAIFPILFPILLAIAISVPIKIIMFNGFLQFSITIFAYIVSLTSIFWFYGMSKSEKETIKNIIKSLRSKFTKG
jgi:hypothetical protein